MEVDRMTIDGTLLRGALLFVTVPLCAGAAHAAGVVTNCGSFGTVGTPGTLADAVAGGGVVTFNCTSGSGDIIVPQLSVTSGSLTIDASASATPITLRGNNANRHFLVNNNAHLTLRRLTLRDGRAAGADVDGGSIAVIDARITIEECLFQNNNVNGSGGTRNRGGAIAIVNAVNTAADNTIEDSTFDDNVVISSDAALGGALYLLGGTLGVRNSTFHSANAAQGNSGSGGGAIALESAVNATLIHLTVSGNVTSAGLGGGGILFSSSVASISNSIVTENTAPGGSRDVQSTASAPFPGTYCLIGDGDGSNFTFGPTNLVGTTASPLNPRLALMTSFGGPTPTRPPQPASPANNAIPTANCPLAVDQRGAPRTAGQPCTMGAVECDWTLVATGGTPQTTPVLTDFPVLLAVRLADQIDLRLSGIQIDLTAPPQTGPSATFGASTLSTGEFGTAQVRATANAIPGSYQVIASTVGVSPGAAFDLTNGVVPVTLIDFTVE
jgi:hypothetical protein